MWIHLLSLGLIDGAGGNPGVSGSLATTNANDTLSAAGATTITGSLARTNANDTLSAAGSTTVSGSLARTNANDTLAASGAAGAITGTLAVTNNNDTLSAFGVVVGGSDVPGIDISFGRSVKTPKWWEKSGQDQESEPEAPPEKKKQKKIPGRDEAKRIIAEVAASHATRGDIKQSERFAEVRSKVKPLGKEAAGFNWPALYDRMYSQALTDAIRQEMEQAAQLEAIRIQQLDDDALILLLLEA